MSMGSDETDSEAVETRSFCYTVHSLPSAEIVVKDGCYLRAEPRRRVQIQLTCINRSECHTPKHTCERISERVTTS
jgi:hypothetical protein